MNLLAFIGLLIAHPVAASDSASADGRYPESELTVPSSVHVVVSGFGTYGLYSTDTRSKGASTYFTLNSDWKDYYTIGYATLWLERDDMGGRYYSQQLVAARGSWLLESRIDLFGVYAYLHESEIEKYSFPAAFHFAGGGGSYWFSPSATMGASFVASWSESMVKSNSARGFYSLQIMDGVWATTSVTLTKAEWTPSLVTVRQSVSVSLGRDNYLYLSMDVGRRGLFFDDELLIAYNQREVQTGSHIARGTIRLFEHFYLIPLLEYDTFDGYHVKYGSIGLRISY